MKEGRLAVNLSWRLQEVTKQVGRDLVMGEQVVVLIDEHFEIESLGSVYLPSLEQTVNVFAVKPEDFGLPLPEARVAATLVH